MVANRHVLRMERRLKAIRDREEVRCCPGHLTNRTRLII